MTEKEIIFKTQEHPEWKGLKITNPSYYKKLKRQAITDRFQELRPIYRKWQKRPKRFYAYEHSLPEINRQLASIDFENYQNGGRSKLEVLRWFCKECLCYPAYVILAACKNYPEQEWNIKDLINSSVIQMYKMRNLVRQRLITLIGNEEWQSVDIPLWGYLPLYNDLIGKEWLKELYKDGFAGLSIAWSILLCFDEKMFSSDPFMQKVVDEFGCEITLFLVSDVIDRLEAKDKFLWQEFPLSYKQLLAWRKFLTEKIRKTNKNKHDPLKELKAIKDQLTSNSRNVASNKQIAKTDSMPVSAMDDPVIKTLESLVRGVPASDFCVSNGYMTYKKYILYSEKIKSEIPSSVLSLIIHKYNIKTKVNITKSGKLKNKRFYFEPMQDLFLFLVECERLRETTDITPSSLFPISGEFYLPWRYVLFYDGVMYLAHPNPSKHGSVHPFGYRHPSIARSFRDLMSYIEARCTKFKVRAEDGVIVELLNFQSFQNMIPQFCTRSSGTYGGIDDISYNKLNNSYGSSEFSSLKFVKKSPYLSHLASRHVSSRKIYRILERVIHAHAETDHDEFGFLFTVKEYKSYSWIIYENVSDESRSSVVFQVRTADFSGAIEVIRSFFASREANKRQRLSQSTIRFKSPSILSYRRIHHTNFSEWKSTLSSIL